jgi:hypothetical protein
MQSLTYLLPSRATPSARSKYAGMFNDGDHPAVLAFSNSRASVASDKGRAVLLLYCGSDRA